MLASASVASSNSWAYAPIAPVVLLANRPYTVAVNVNYAYNHVSRPLPISNADITINRSCYNGTTAEPCGLAGAVISTTEIFGLADVKYYPLADTGGQRPGFYQALAPAALHGTDVVNPSGTTYNMGYELRPERSIIVTHLGGRFPFASAGSTVRLYRRAGGAVLASATVVGSSNGWSYAELAAPVTLAAGQIYSVAVFLPSHHDHYNHAMPIHTASNRDVTVTRGCSISWTSAPASTPITDPCGAGGIASTTRVYGIADLKYAPAQPQVDNHMYTSAGASPCTFPGAIGDVFPGGMVGCKASTTWYDANQAAWCGPGYHVCTSTEWELRRGNIVPTHNYWLGDWLGYAGTGSRNCSATYPGNACSYPMRICRATQADAEGNSCNWTGCGLSTTTPGDFFGGCEGNPTAGVLCCASGGAGLCLDAYDPTFSASGFSQLTSQQCTYENGNPSYDNMQWVLYDWALQTLL